MKKMMILVFTFMLFFVTGCDFATASPQANVKFYNDGELLYSTKVNIGEYANYAGQEPCKESVEDGIYIVNYIFDGWDYDLLISEEKDYEFNARFIAEREYNPKYENISNREGLKNYIINNCSEYYNGEYRYIIKGSYYVAYIPSSDSFKLVYGGGYVMSITFEYQNMSYGSGFASINGYQNFTFSVNDHKVSSCSVSSLTTALTLLIEVGNEFSIKNGFGFISD